MALLETLVASALIGMALVLFVGILKDARFSLTRTRENVVAAALGPQILQQAGQSWPSSPNAGAIAEFTWTSSCARSPELQSPRLELLTCRVALTSRTGASFALSEAFARPKPNVFQPSP